MESRRSSKNPRKMEQLHLKRRQVTTYSVTIDICIYMYIGAYIYIYIYTYHMYNTHAALPSVGFSCKNALSWYAGIFRELEPHSCLWLQVYRPHQDLHKAPTLAWHAHPPRHFPWVASVGPCFLLEGSEILSPVLKLVYDGCIVSA